MSLTAGSTTRNMARVSSAGSLCLAAPCRRRVARHASHLYAKLVMAGDTGYKHGQLAIWLANRAKSDVERDGEVRLLDSASNSTL
jgi:hypothetical protein